MSPMAGKHRIIELFSRSDFTAVFSRPNEVNFSHQLSMPNAYHDWCRKFWNKGGTLNNHVYQRREHTTLICYIKHYNDSV